MMSDSCLGGSLRGRGKNVRETVEIREGVPLFTQVTRRVWNLKKSTLIYLVAGTAFFYTICRMLACPDQLRCPCVTHSDFLSTWELFVHSLDRYVSSTYCARHCSRH